MKTNPITSLEFSRICGLQPQYGNIEVEHSASPILRQASQGHDGHTAHPSNSGDGNRTPRTWVGKESAAMKDELSSGNVPPLNTELGLAFDKISQRSVEIDTAKYQKYLNDPALSDGEKEEIVLALWTLITGFMDLGFGVQPMQEVCGKTTDALDHDGPTDSNRSKPKSMPLQDAFNAASDDT